MATNLDKWQPAGGELADNTASLVAAWLEYERQEGAAPTTLDAYRKGLDVFMAWLLATGRAGDVTPETVRKFKAELAETYSAQTVNLRLAAVRSFFRYLVTTDRLAVNPAAEVRGMKRPKSRRHKRDALTDGEVVDVLETCQIGTLLGIRDRAILSLMAFCGLREIEVHRANLGNLKTQGDRLVLEVHGKGRLEADQVVIIPRHEERALRAWLTHRRTFRHHGAGDPLFISLSNRSRGARLSLRSIRGVVKARYATAGVVGDDKTAHSLRHSAITNAIRQGGSPMQVQAMARHSSFDTTLGYYHEVARLDNPAEDLIFYGESE